MNLVRKRSLSTSDITRLQTDIMQFVDVWVHTEKTPVPSRMIFVEMKKTGIVDETFYEAMKSLVRKGYLRRTVRSGRQNISYIQLRRV